MTNEALGAAFIVEGDDVSFPDIGFTLAALQPGQASMYHREPNQENFLVLAGECLLLIEAEERPLKRGTSGTARRTPSTPSSGQGTVPA